MVRLRVFVSVFAGLTVATVFACSSDTAQGSDGGTSQSQDGGPVGDEDSVPTSDCAKTTNVSDGKTTDDTIAVGAPQLICYYAQPAEGYCRKITDRAKIDNYAKGGTKGGMGCADAVILAGPDCPVKNAVGKCDANTIEAQRVYYKCSKFPDAKAHCAQIGGTFTAL